MLSSKHPVSKPDLQATKFGDYSRVRPLLATQCTKVTGAFLYYTQAVDYTILVALGSIATQQSKPTENTMQKVKQYLNYAATHPDVIVTYRESDMILATHSNASYLSKTNAISCVGEHFYM